MEDQPSLASLFIPHLPLFDSIHTEIQNSDQLQLLKENIQHSEAIGPWKYKDGLLFFKQRVYLLHNSPLVPSIISTVHNSNHEGYHKTLHRIAQDFYWQGMKTFIQAFTRQFTSSRSSSTFANSTSDLVEYLYGFH